MGEQGQIEFSFDYVPLVVLLMSLVIMAVINSLYRKKLISQIECFINPRYMDQVMRDESSSSQLPMSLLQLNAILNFGCLLYLAEKHYAFTGLESWKLFSLCVLSIVGVMLSHVVLSFFTQYVMRTDNGFGLHRYLVQINYQVIGVVLIPLNIFAAFSAFEKNAFLIVGLLVVSIGLLYRYALSFLTALAQRISAVYIILYLCTLEILPLVVVIGVLMGEKVEIN